MLMVDSTDLLRMFQKQLEIIFKRAFKWGKLTQFLIYARSQKAIES